MPMGKGTYGKKVGRPPKKKKENDEEKKKEVIGFTTTATISELIDKRPMTKRRGRSKRRLKTSFKAPERVLKVKKV